MIEAVAFTYSLLASFVLSSVERNRRRQLPTAPVIVMLGWMLVAVSVTLPVLLIGDRAWQQLAA